MLGLVNDIGYDNFRRGNVAVRPIPEPKAYAILLAGLGLFGFMVHRRRVIAAIQT